MKTLSHGFDWLRLLAFVLLFMGIAGYAMAAKTYSDNGDGTVTDPTTGLVWMRCAMGQVWDGTTCTGTAGTYTFDQANALTGTVTFAGQGDWRLPNIRELQTIVDRSVFNPAIDKAAFPNTPASFFWSASANASITGGAWYVFFYFGYYSSHLGFDNKSYAHQVRLVRAGQSINLLNVSRPSSDYVDHADGTVTHTPTGLMWQKCAVGQIWSVDTCTGTANTYSWSAAQQLTNNLAEQTDWRLPTEDELLSLVDYSKSSQTINTSIFPTESALDFWSASAYAGNSVNAWYVWFGNGCAYNDGYKGSALQVRLVRAGQFFSFFPLNISKNGTGTVSSAFAGINCGAACTGSYTPGTQIILTATPAANLISWGGDCASSGTATTCTVTMDAAKNINANFATTMTVTTTTTDYSTTTLATTTTTTQGLAPFTVTLSAPIDSMQVANSVNFSGTVRGNTGTNLSFSLLFGTTRISAASTSLSSSCVNSYCTSSFSSFFQWATGLISNGSQVVSLVTTDSSGRTASVNRLLNLNQSITTTSTTTTAVPTTSTTTTTVAATTTTTLANPNATLVLLPGWNLLGNGTDQLHHRQRVLSPSI